MQTNELGLSLIKQSEGLRLASYRCPAGKLTIGFGHTGPDVTVNQRINLSEANRLLAKDVERFECHVRRKITRVPTTNQFSAMVSLCYNIGTGAFTGSSVLRLFNEGKVNRAATSFLLWNKIRNPKPHGKLEVSEGLTRRRNAEAALFRLKGKRTCPLTHLQPGSISAIN